MAKWFRYLLLFSGTGVIWHYAMPLFFVWSGAQSVLANPQYQGDKFIKNFTEYEPMPYMAFDRWFVLKGPCICWCAVCYSVCDISTAYKRRQGEARIEIWAGALAADDTLV